MSRTRPSIRCHGHAGHKWVNMNHCARCGEWMTFSYERIQSKVARDIEILKPFFKEGTFG